MTKTRKGTIQMDLDNIALIMMATRGGRMSPALYGIPLDRVEEFLERPETEGFMRGSHWFLCYTTPQDYMRDITDGKVRYIPDTGAQDALLEFMGIPKYDAKEIIKAMGYAPVNKKAKRGKEEES